MIGFQPYETFQLLIETGGIERANTLLVAACDAFARRPRPPRGEVEQFEALVKRLFPTAAPSARQKGAAILAGAPTLTPEIERLILENIGDGLAAYVAKAPSLGEAAMLGLIQGGDTEIVAALAGRPDLSGTALHRVFSVNSRKVYRALAGNPAVAPRGPYLSALTRSARMDHEVARTLAMREDYDAALLSPVFFDLPEAGRLRVLGAYARRTPPQVPMMRTFEQISVATGEFTRALMKLLSENRRPRITRLLQQVTGLDELRCGEIAHDTTGAALFVVLRAFGCTEYDGLKVLIHATSHDEDRSKSLAAFAALFEEVEVAAMVHLMSVWRGEADPAELSRPEHAPVRQESRRTPAAEAQPRRGRSAEEIAARKAG